MVMGQSEVKVELLGPEVPSAEDGRVKAPVAAMLRLAKVPSVVVDPVSNKRRSIRKRKMKRDGCVKCPAADDFEDEVPTMEGGCQPRC